MRAVGAGALKFVVATLALTLLAWAASELHYRACVSAAAARTPVKVLSTSSGDGFGGGGGGGLSSAVSGASIRYRAVNGCSRLP
jgi:hypothetical protein